MNTIVVVGLMISTQMWIAGLCIALIYNQIVLIMGDKCWYACYIYRWDKTIGDLHFSCGIIIQCNINLDGDVAH